MRVQRGIDRVVERCCLFLGRYGRWSDWLDRLVNWLVPGSFAPFLLPGGAAVLRPMPLPIFMPGERSNQPGVYDTNKGPTAPTRPHRGEPGDPPHSTRECGNPKYRGMHGRPCRYSGGSDQLCPYGTVSGLWWRWYVPRVGNVYYVDCCGMPSDSKVWCNWAKEWNWCAGRGNNVYTCTLALLHSELHKDADGFADPTYHVPSGPPASDRAPYTP